VEVVEDGVEERLGVVAARDAALDEEAAEDRRHADLAGQRRRAPLVGSRQDPSPLAHAFPLSETGG
jgi:hypothetical protein